MTTCELNRTYSIGKVEDNKFYYFRNIGLSEDFKKIRIKKYKKEGGTEKPEDDTNTECELSIEGEGIGLHLDYFDLKIEDKPIPASQCSMIIELIIENQ